MKRLLFFTVLLCSPAFAEELPVIWFGAGGEYKLHHSVFSSPPPSLDWSLRFEHRILLRGSFGTPVTGVAVHEMILDTRKFGTQLPPIRPGITLKAQLFFDDTPYFDVVLASFDPFEDRKTWIAEHHFAVYDPEGKTIDYFEDHFDDEPKFSFDKLSSFAEIEATEIKVILVGQGVSFEKEKGLAEVLFEKAAKGHSILVLSPEGDVPLPAGHPIYSLLLSENAKYIFPMQPRRQGSHGSFALQADVSDVVLTPSNVHGPRLLDIRFAKVSIQDGAVPTGRFLVDKAFAFPERSHWNQMFRTPPVEDMYYFKSLIETLTCK